MASDLTPLWDLRLRTPRLELRLPEREEILVLARLAEEGIHPPEEMPFFVPWTDRAGEPGFVEEFLDFHEEARRSWSPASWSLHLGAWAAGEPAGSQSIEAEDFARTRVVSTGSWLGRRFQRRGLGTEMRAAVLALAFRGLRAEVARSGALDGNVGSLRVSEKLGYERAGEGLASPRGEPVRETKLELTRERWAAGAQLPVTITGLEPCLPLFGVPRPA